MNEVAVAVLIGVVLGGVAAILYLIWGERKGR